MVEDLSEQPKSIVPRLEIATYPNLREFSKNEHLSPTGAIAPAPQFNCSSDVPLRGPFLTLVQSEGVSCQV